VRFDLGLDFSDDSVPARPKSAPEDIIVDFQQNPVLESDGLRQIKHCFACLGGSVGRGAIGAGFLGVHSRNRRF